MIETNIRILRPGRKLVVPVRDVRVEGPDLSVDLLQRACNELRKKHGLAAVPSVHGQVHLLVACQSRVPNLRLEQEDWVLEISDGADSSRLLSLESLEGQEQIPSLIERALLAQLGRNRQLWTLDSPRIWYEREPFRRDADIAALRRFEVASLNVEGVGVGIVADVSTAFFTRTTLAYFFDWKQPKADQERRRRLFESLTKRQEEQKGTLLYDTGHSKVKCYFEDAAEGVTCGSTGKVRVKGKDYPSLTEYYKVNLPKLTIADGEPAVRVSFPGLERPQWVAADRLRVRIMNEYVPETLSQVDKISPKERCELLEGFWRDLGDRPFGNVAPGLFHGFWRPQRSRVRQLAPVALEFGKGRRLSPPIAASVQEYREYYRSRAVYLREGGCFFLPPNAIRTLYCAYPEHVAEEAVRALAGDVITQLRCWTGVPFEASLISYNSIPDATEQLRRKEPATVLFLLDQSPAAYYEVAFQLNGWRAKRVTEDTLTEHHKYLASGAFDKKLKEVTREKGRSRWEQFVTMTALDVLQQMDAIPWRYDPTAPYDAIIAIDVGHDRRHFAVSLLLCRASSKTPGFGIYSNVQVKPDTKKSSINPVMLADEIVRLFEKALPKRFDPIDTVLVLRDGSLCGDESKGVDDGLGQLATKGVLANSARVDLADLHKDSLKSVRLWERTESGQIHNPLEGTCITLSNRMIVVASTGGATLHQGTAEPFVIVANGRCKQILDAATACFEAAQLNWASPGVAQKLPLPFKRTDEELKARSAQEIRRTR